MLSSYFCSDQALNALDSDKGALANLCSDKITISH